MESCEYELLSYFNMDLISETKIGLSSMVWSRSMLKTFAFSCWSNVGEELPESSLHEAIEKLGDFSTEISQSLISLFKASMGFLSFIAFSSSRLREVLEVLDDESTIVEWIKIYVVERGCSMAVGEVCEVEITRGCSFPIIEVWMSLWSWSLLVWPTYWSLVINQHVPNYFPFEHCHLGHVIFVHDLDFMVQLMVAQNVDLRSLPLIAQQLSSQLDS